MQFNPKPGDTIVTAERGNYTCVARKSSYYGNADFYGESAGGGWSSWMHDGRTESEARPTPTKSSVYSAYRVVEIIPASVQAQESTLEFKLRVLEKENQMLVRLLLKEGKL